MRGLKYTKANTLSWQLFLTVRRRFIFLLLANATSSGEAVNLATTQSRPLFAPPPKKSVNSIGSCRFANALYVGLSLAAMCATSFQEQFGRYLVPLFPFLALALFELLAWATAQARRRWPALPAALGVAIPWLVIIVVGLRATYELRGMYAHSHDEVAYEHLGHPVRYRLFYYAAEGIDFDAALDWLQRRATPDDTLASREPHWVYLRTGRRSVVIPFVIDGREGQRLIDSVPVKYLLVSVKNRKFEQFTAALLAENPGAWRRVWSGANGTLDVYERVEAPFR